MLSWNKKNPEAISKVLEETLISGNHIAWPSATGAIPAAFEAEEEGLQV